MNEYEDRESALALKIKYFQRKLRELKEEIDFRSVIIRESKAKALAAKEIEVLREQMKNSLYDEVNNLNKNNENLRKSVNLLQDEVRIFINFEQNFDLENENSFFTNKITQLREDNNSYRSEDENFKRKIALTEREFSNIKDKFNIKEKSKFSSLNDNDLQNNIIDKISNELYETKIKSEEIKRKVDEIRDKLIREKDNISYERKLCEDLNNINERLSESVMKRKQEISTIELKIRNINSDIKENAETVVNSQKDSEMLIKKLQYLYDQIYAINTANNEVLFLI